MVSPSGRAGIRVVPSLPVPGQPRGCGEVGIVQAGREVGGSLELTRGIIVSRREVWCMRLRNGCGRVGWRIARGGQNAYESVCMGGDLCRLVRGSTSPRLDGMSISGYVWSLDRRQSVSKPRPFQADKLQHRNGTGSLWGVWVGGRSDADCVTTEWPLERQRDTLVGARVACVEGEGPRGRMDWRIGGWQTGRWDEWTGEMQIASKLNWNWIW